MYRVLIKFKDGEKGRPWPSDKGGHSYAVGDVYPKSGFKPEPAHIQYLLGSKNAFGKPVIAKADKEK